MTTAWFSLRRRLLGLLLGGVAAAWLATTVFGYIDAHHEVDELFDAQLAQAAQTLLALAGHDEGDDIEDLGDVTHKYQRRLRFQIWRADGKLLMRSKNAPKTPLTATNGFSETRGKNGHWRHFSQWNEERSLQVQVSENHHIRDDLIGHIAWRLLFPALFGLPLIGLWVWLATRHGVASLDDLGREIEKRALENVGENQIGRRDRLGPRNERDDRDVKEDQGREAGGRAPAVEGLSDGAHRRLLSAAWRDAGTRRGSG